MLSMCCICFNIMKYGYFTLVIQENLYLLVLHSTELLRMSLVMVIDAASMQNKCIATVDTVHLWWTYLEALLQDFLHQKLVKLFHLDGFIKLGTGRIFSIERCLTDSKYTVLVMKSVKIYTECY